MSAVLKEGIEFRPLKLDELQAVSEIERDVYAFPWSYGNFRDSMQAGYSCWGCFDAGRLLAYAIVMIAAGEAHLLNITVAKGWQRHGIGTQLLGFVTNLARERGCDSLYLEVRPSNVGARALYSRDGFKQLGLRRDYYPAVGGREDALVLLKRL